MRKDFAKEEATMAAHDKATLQAGIRSKPKHPRCLAADLGAGSGRTIVGQLVDSHLRLTEVSRFVTPSKQDGGYLCWGLDEIESHVRSGIDLAASMAPITSVGVDSWGVDYVLLDSHLERIGYPICYRDSRTEGMMERIQAKVPSEEIYRRTGIQFQPYNTIYQLAAMAEQEPEWTTRASHLLMLPDYLHFRLSGVLSNEYTNATTTQLYGLNGEWDGVLLKAVGLPLALMRAPVDAGSGLGFIKVGGQTAKVIAPATHDTASAVVAAPLQALDEAFISSGTWSLMGIESLVPLNTAEAMHLNFSNEGGFGHRYRVLKNIMGLWLMQRLCPELHVVINDELLIAARDSASWRSIINPDDARFMNPVSMKEAMFSYCWQTQQPVPESAAQYARCVFDSLALSYRKVKEELETISGKSLKNIRIIGGGCKNRLLNQLSADACQLPVSAGPSEASALGNICAQMIALGEIGGLDQARAIVRNSITLDVYKPMDEIPQKVWSQFQELTKVRVQEANR